MATDLSKRMAAAYLWVGSICLLLLCHPDTRVNASTCPGVCFCPSLSRIVYCHRKFLATIPSGIPQDTVQLNLNDNMFDNPVISRANFTRYGDLEQLYLTGCGIEYIEVDTFIDIKKLKWLDIGKNKLKTISDFTFRDLTLDHLFLNDNPGVKISMRAFGGMKSTGLYIQNNVMDKLSLEVLRPMNGTLKTLWLDGNKFEGFNSQWMYLFKTLSHLRIGDNPLHCNCEAAWLFSFYKSTSLIFEGGTPPTCRSPGRLRGKSFGDLQEDDFKCQLPVFRNVDVIFEENVAKMTCLASGDPVPTIYWMKPGGESETFIPKSDSISKEMEGVMYVPNPRSRAKNRYQCVANNPAGNVTFSINVAWPSSQEQYEAGGNQADVAMKDMSSDVQEPKSIVKDSKKYDVKEPVVSKTITDSVESGGGVSGVKNVNTNASSVVGNNMAVTSRQESGMRFTAADIVGAVIGTFLLTLLVCIIVFHVFYKHQRNSTHKANGHSPAADIKKGPPSRYELDEVEHTMKMLEKRNYDIHV